MRFIWECEYPSFSSVLYHTCMKINLWGWIWAPAADWQKDRAPTSCIFEWVVVMNSVPSSLLCSLSNCIKSAASSYISFAGSSRSPIHFAHVNLNHWQITSANGKFKGYFRALSWKCTSTHTHTYTHTHTKVEWFTKPGIMTNVCTVINWADKITHILHTSWFLNIQQKI